MVPLPLTRLVLLLLVENSDCIKWVKVNSGSMESTAGLPLVVGHEMMGENPPDGGQPSCFGPTGHLHECEMSYEQICVTLDGTKDGHRNGPWASGPDVGREREIGPVRVSLSNIHKSCTASVTPAPF